MSIGAFIVISLILIYLIGWYVTDDWLWPFHIKFGPQTVPVTQNQNLQNGGFRSYADCYHPEQDGGINSGQAYHGGASAIQDLAALQTTNSTGCYYKIEYSGTASSQDMNNPEPMVAGQQCSADFPCSSFLKDSATWNWNYVYYAVDTASEVDLSTYVANQSTDTMTYTASWIAIPAMYDPAYSCTNSSNVILNTYYDMSLGAVLSASEGNNNVTTVSSTQYTPWNAIEFICGTYQGTQSPALSPCARGYSDIFNFTLVNGTFPEKGSTTCPSSDDNGTIGGYAGGTFDWSGTITVSSIPCTSLPDSMQGNLCNSTSSSAS